jgi:aldehyde:ferredoxin oxidoreductase
MAKGIWNKLLRVNLRNKEIKVEPIPERLSKEYLGGSGLATKYLYDEVKPKTDPLGPENKIIFSTGPFQGTSILGSAKFSIVSRSPLTGTFAVTAAGAEWGTMLKRAGYDMIIIEGQADKPVYLWINNEKVEFRSANGIWGRDSIETNSLIKKDLEEPKISVACIGPAGEKQVAIACIVVDEHSFAGRCGLGAVLGSKKLKGIAVKGTNNVKIFNEKKLRDLNKKWLKAIGNTAKDTYRAHGTANDVTFCEQAGDLPIKYWTESSWVEGAKKIGAPRFTEELKAKSWPCPYCSVGCHRHVNFNYQGEHIEGAGAEYETLGMLGSNCLVDDVFAISKANDLCNRLGIDTISAGSYVAFTMECFEKGLVTQEDLDGMEAQWGDGKFLIELIRKIGNKEGFGQIFYKGIRAAAAKIGHGAKELTVEVKNLDFPAHDPRTYFSLAINYATSTRGACHLRGYPHVAEIGAMLIPEVGLSKAPKRFQMEGQARLAALFQDIAAVHDSLILCIFSPMLGLSLTDTTKFLNLITGWEMTSQNLMLTGKRIVNLQRQINVNDGICREDDQLPLKMFQPGEEGMRKGKTPEPFERTLSEYYKYRGWDQNGIPI